MALFQITRDIPLPAAEAWRRLTAWERHGDVVPLTRVTVRTPPPTHAGTVFVARSALGPLGFDDVMEVVEWCPPEGTAPGRCRLEKRGTLVTGWAEIEVFPGRSGCHLVWREDLRVRGLPRLCDGGLAAVSRRMFGSAADRLVAAGPVA
ncbi:SRPBCC family protein [Streptomyces luteocolor]|uniref:SRPBCC family protein n=1 Tax=Streptomyces luteocolor TaxID=285500 RepID=UPI0008532A43|nr:SRPBCC family protein [Streptomyces luteocolor]MCF3121824.1 SRPBCC family protein [Streptomyces arenae]